MLSEVLMGRACKVKECFRIALYGKNHKNKTMYCELHKRTVDVLLEQSVQTVNTADHSSQSTPNLGIPSDSRKSTAKNNSTTKNSSFNQEQEGYQHDDECFNCQVTTIHTFDIAF